MRKSTLKNVFQAILATGTLVAALGTAAHAANAAQVHVNYADLKISTPVGANVLYQRIRVAASEVCGTTDQRDLARIEHLKACTDKAIGDAVAAVGEDTLTDLYQAKTQKLAVSKFASN